MSLLSAFKAAGVSAKTAREGDVIICNEPEAVVKAAEFAGAYDKAKAAEANTEVFKAEVYSHVRQFYFDVNAGRPAPWDGVRFPIPGGRNVLASIGTQFSAKIPEGVLAMIPKPLLRERVTIKIDGDKVPAKGGDAFVAELLALGKRFGVPVELTAGALVPVEDFNVRRHVELTPADNLALEAAGLGTRITLRVSR